MTHTPFPVSDDRPPHGTVRAALLMLLLGGGLAAPLTSAWAQTVDAGIVIKGFQVVGENPLNGEDTNRALAGFLRSPASLDTLQRATAALEAALVASGHGLHRVSLPPQDVSEVMTLEIVRFTVSHVTVAGAVQFDEDNVRRSLPELKEEGVPNFKTLAVQTAMVNENPGKQVQVSFRESDQPDQIDALVTVTESRPWQMSAGLSNTGNAASGRDRATLSAGHSNLFNRDHQVVAAYTTSLERTGDVSQLGLSYRVPLYGLKTVLGLSYTRSDVVGNFGTFSSNGAGHTLGLNATYYLASQGGRRTYLSLSWDDKVFDVAKINDIEIPGQLTRRSRPLTLSYSARSETDARFLSYNVDLALNTSGGSGNNLAAYTSEDPRVGTTRWKALRGNVTYLMNLPSQWQLQLRSQFQYSPDALISGEQFGLGGATSVRGTGERALSADRGVMASAELLSAELNPGLRLAGFVDAGWLSNQVSDNATRPASDRLLSVGFGFRYNTPAITFTADYGRVLTGSVVPSDLSPAAPQKGDYKLHVNLQARF